MEALALIPHSLIPQLAAAADAALLSVLQKGAIAYGQTRPTGEVGFVAAAVLAGLPAIACAWAPILRPAGYQLWINGVFCHQTPQATFTDSKGVTKPCELADLLVVVDDLTIGKARRRWATLIQAKMADASGGKTINKTNDLRQLDLFLHWPEFTLSPGYCPRTRDFSTCQHNGNLLDCGRYGLIDKQPAPDWHQQAPAKKMPSGGHRLGSFLAHMVESGQVGFGREATGTGDDWSRTVEELLQVTYANVFNYVTGFGPNNPQPRRRAAVAYMASGGPQDFSWYINPMFEQGGPPSGGRPDYPAAEDPEGVGISLLHIGIARDRREE